MNGRLYQSQLRASLCLLLAIAPASAAGNQLLEGPGEAGGAQDATKAELSASARESGAKAADTRLPGASAIQPSGYRIGPGDTLQIVVYKEADASVPSVVVRPDGKITMPLIKEIAVAGLTPAEVEKLLAARLVRFIRDADVTVIPREIVSQRIYLVGAVRREGPIPLLSSMNVLQALNAAGGLTEYAKKRKIYVLRSENGKQTRLPFDYTAVIRGEHPEQNIELQLNDTVVVP